MTKTRIKNIRTHYGQSVLNEEALPLNPFILFEQWLADALDIKLLHAHCMTLSTVSLDGQPSSRIVLLRGFDNDRFEFFTNYQSRKGQQISENPRVALNFFWSELERQVEVEGVVTKMSEKDSEDYFHSRPRESQLSAWVSKQSKSLSSREYIETSYKSYEKLFDKASEIPRPSHWGGYYVIPSRIEFWQGRLHRLHDRIVFSRDVNDEWKITRLAP